MLRLRLCSLFFAGALAACTSSGALKAPTSDKNFDDPDDPGNGGAVGAVDASTADAGSGVIPCTKSSDCPSSTYTCYFPTGDGCSAKGQCIVYGVSSGCLVHNRCGCDGKALKECSPEGFASAPVKSDSACGGGDAGSDSGGSDASGDAPLD